MKVFLVFCWGQEADHPDCPLSGDDWAWLTCALSPEEAGQMADEDVRQIYPDDPEKCANCIYELCEWPACTDKMAICGPLKGKSFYHGPETRSWGRDTRAQPWMPHEELFPKH
jgi:hypothetical protein